MKSLRQSLENLLKEDSAGSESDEEGGERRPKTNQPTSKKQVKSGLKRSSFSAHNHFAQLRFFKDSLMMDQIEEKVEP